MGNLKSVLNAFLFNNIEAQITDRVEDLKCADKLVVPGVGAFPDAIKELRKKDLINGIKEFNKSGKYYLGICLGMQLLFNRSFEFVETEGLNILMGDISYFPEDVKKKGFKVPHMGWNTVNIIKKHSIFDGIDNGSCFYFDHSYASFAENDSSAGVCVHGCKFNAMVIKDNIIGVQFHPEKSGIKGLKMMANFADL